MEWKMMFNDRYKISEKGDIISLPKTTYRVIFGVGRYQTRKETKMKPHLTKKGYLSVILSISEAKLKGYQLHRLLYSMFIGEIPENYDVHHKDENKSNNSLSNLELIKHSIHTSKHKLGSSWNKPKKEKIIKEKKDRTLNKTFDMKSYQKKYRELHRDKT